MSVQTAIAQEVPAGILSNPPANRLLASLPQDDYGRMAPYLRRVSLRSRQSLLRQGQPVQEIIFPVNGVCSLVKTTEDGHTVEIIGIGSEGAIGATVVLGLRESAADVMTLVSDDAALSLPLDVLKGELQQRDGLFTQMTQYCGAFSLQLMQVSACNARHSAEQRCCRWLLTTQDRLQGKPIPITQEMLAMTLGIRRPTVTLIMANLLRAGLVDCGRGTIAILDRTTLRARSCECYPILSPGFVSYRSPLSP
jgi:CRP-like cAMP-binding protein